jgi:hypothetical protein
VTATVSDEPPPILLRTKLLDLRSGSNSRPIRWHRNRQRDALERRPQLSAALTSTIS